jgi:hypothetical protein
MQDVTNILLEYLEAKRHLWNVYFRGRTTSIYDCSPLDQYEEIDRLLFFSLVVSDLEISSFCNEIIWKEPIPWLRVVPRTGLDRIPVMFGEATTDSSIKWSLPTELVIDSALILCFVEFFEWDRYGYVSYPYYRARIFGYTDPTLLGRELLIETINARVFFTDSEAG